jgi:hypothetical protein
MTFLHKKTALFTPDVNVKENVSKLHRAPARLQVRWSKGNIQAHEDKIHDDYMLERKYVEIA